MSLEAAIQVDAQDRPVEAIEAYERAIRAPHTDKQAFFNLVALYFMLADPGFASHHRVPRELIERSWDDAHRVLKLAEKRYTDPEVRFWRLYLPFVVLGKQPDIDAFKRLMDEGGTRLPVVLLLGLPGGEVYARDARFLLESLKGDSTARARYIRSVIEATLRRMEGKRGGRQSV